MCMCAYVYLCMYIYIYIYTYINVNIYIDKYILAICVLFRLTVATLRDGYGYGGNVYVCNKEV